MNTEEDEFNRIEREAGMRQAAVKATVAKREWIDLTIKEVEDVIDEIIGFNSCCGWEEEFARAIEHAVKEKNGGK
jgi:hypothetical protein